MNILYSPASSLALAAIRFYRRFLSPLKGYRCAYGVAHGTSTCSGQGLRIFRRAGFFKGMKLLRRQFDACTLAAVQLRDSRSEQCRIREHRVEEDDQGGYLRYRRLSSGYARSQAGLIDCDCDCGGGPDCGSGTDCDLCGKGPDCTPDCPDCNPRTSMCRAASNWLDAIDCCCDGSSICDTSDKKGFERRVAAARDRQAQREAARDERRRQRNGNKDSETSANDDAGPSDDSERDTVRHGDHGRHGNDGDQNSASDTWEQR